MGRGVDKIDNWGNHVIFRLINIAENTLNVISLSMIFSIRFLEDKKMSENRRVHFIPPKHVQREKRVGIYCRVSSNSMEQLNTLTNQVSALTRLTAVTPNWLLVDTYIDIASGKTGSKRKEFMRMLEDCQAKNIEIIITKNISRFGRDTVEVLESLHKLREHGVRVIFEQEGLNTADTDSELMISIIEYPLPKQKMNPVVKILNGVIDDMRHKTHQNYITENVMAMKMIWL